MVEIAANNGEAIVNELKYGSVSGLKTGEDGEALEGALIGLFAPGTEEFTEDTALMTAVSAEKLLFKQLHLWYNERCWKKYDNEYLYRSEN